MGKCYIIIVNYLNWQDTIECIESLNDLNYSDVGIIIIDNCSPNDSYDKLYNYCAGNKNIELMKADKNKGFAAGNNIGLSYITEKNDYEYVWILNNDTIVNPNALGNVIKRFLHSEKIGICSMHVFDYPDIVSEQWNNQIKYNKWIGEVVANRDKDNNCKMIYSGMSFIIKRTCLEDIGFMDEEYFLYREEQDWAIKCEKYGYSIEYCENAIIYHKGGKSTGKGSYLSWFYLMHSSLMLAKKFHVYCLPTVICFWMMRVIKRFFIGDYIFCKAVITAIVHFFRSCIDNECN